jgi:ketosteroid isomerase-like protein
MGELFDIFQKIGSATLAQDWDALGSHFADDVEAWSPSYDLRGRDAFVEAIKAQNGLFADIRQDIKLVAETEDTVVGEWVWSIPHPSDVERRAELPGLSYYVFQGGKVVKLRQYWDVASFMAQFESETEPD